MTNLTIKVNNKSFLRTKLKDQKLILQICGKIDTGAKKEEIL